MPLTVSTRVSGSDLGNRLSLSDRYVPPRTEVNGTLMAQRSRLEYPATSSRPRVWCTRFMEDIPAIDEQSVLALVNELRDANPGKRTFTLLEIADALGGPGTGSASFAATTSMDDEGKIVKPRRLMSHWMEVLNEILKKLGQEDKLVVTTVAVVVSSTGRAVVQGPPKS
jgi:hypothetical protein